MIINAQDGKLSLGTQRAVDDFAVLPTPVLPLSAEERALYGDNLGENIRDTTLTPDFPRAATLMAAMLKRSFGTDVDGIISVDPVVLSSVLRATGPIEVGEETFTARNVVRKLLNEVYQRFDTRAQQDVYFDGVARGIFDTLVTREVQPLKVLRKPGQVGQPAPVPGLEQPPRGGAAARRNRGERELPRDTGRRPHVGLYLNDGTAAKIEYYLDYRPSLRSAGCTARGAQTLQVGMTLSSSAPRRGFQLSSYVAGFGQYAARGTMRLNLRVYAPTGGRITSLVANGQPVPMVTREHDGRQVAIVTMFIRARQEVRLAAEFRTRAGQRGDPVLDWTPGVRTTSSGTTAASSC